MNSPQQHQFDDDYFEVLDAGEHMYGMFVADDEDLYAYLSSDDEPSLTEDIEDFLSTGIVPGIDLQPCVQACCSAEARGSKSDHDNSSNNSDSPNTGRLTPTQNVNDDHDAMRE